MSTISRIMNHAEGGVTRLYNGSWSFGEKAEALNRWSRKMKGCSGRSWAMSSNYGCEP